MAADLQHRASIENPEIKPPLAPAPDLQQTHQAAEEIKAIRSSQSEHDVINRTVPALGEEDRRDFGVHVVKNNRAPTARPRVKIDSAGNRVPLAGDIPPTGPDNSTLGTSARPTKPRQEETDGIVPRIHKEGSIPVKENLPQSHDRDNGTYDDGTGTLRSAWKQKGGTIWKTEGRNAIIADPDRVSPQDLPPEQAVSSDPENTPPESPSSTMEKSVGAPKTATEIAEKQFSTEDLVPPEYPTSDAGNYAFKKGETLEPPKMAPGIEEKRFTSEEQASGKYTSPDGQTWDIPPGSTGATWEKTSKGNRVTFQTQRSNETKETSSPETSKNDPNNPNQTLTAELPPDTTPMAVEPGKKETEEATIGSLPRSDKETKHTSEAAKIMRAPDTSKLTFDEAAEDSAYKGAEKEFISNIQNGRYIVTDKDGKETFTPEGRSTFRKLSEMPKTSNPDDLFSRASIGMAISSDEIGYRPGPDKVLRSFNPREESFQAIERRFFENRKLHRELAEGSIPENTQVALTHKTHNRTASEDVWNRTPETIEWDMGRGVYFGGESADPARYGDYSSQTKGVTQLMVFSKEKNVLGQPKYGARVFHPDDPKFKEIQAGSEGRHINFYETELNGQKLYLQMLGQSYGDNAFSLAYGDMPAGPKRIVKPQEIIKESLN